VVSKPNHKTPARPVAPAEHEYSAKDCDKPDEAYPENVIVKRTPGLELGGVVCNSDDACGYEYPTDDRDGERTFAHTTLQFKRQRHCESAATPCSMASVAGYTPCLNISNHTFVSASP
jgi:hypothetical protein